ncbi:MULTISPECIES: 2-oxoacid:acceptor oxidoreductase family protein [Desulfosediminicola]|uniref:2-oxoacid:acceptor oxidoreductase family protein n=1 Tax=Desulfosediminicola TaxID=2886823 RepID=UPI0010ADA495|nr:2-oxoacid:acceptor oxidoreductase family protein [Desulfosediminicola ganghwensis]
MKQQIVVSGIGGQGVLFLTRVIAQVAVDQGIPVLTSESHGMAQRGGTVLSTLKIGNFAAPLIRTGQADVALFLWDANLPVHQPLMKEGGALFINSNTEGVGERIDASAIAREMGKAVLSNLVLLGRAVNSNALFCTEGQCLEAIEKLAPPKFVEQNLQAFQAGLRN